MAARSQSARMEGISSVLLRKQKQEKDATKGRGGVLFFSETCCTVGLCLLFLAQIAVANYIAYQMWFVRLSKETTARTCFPCCLHPIMRSAQIRFLMLHRTRLKLHGPCFSSNRIKRDWVTNQFSPVGLIFTLTLRKSSLLVHLSAQGFTGG